MVTKTQYSLKYFMRVLKVSLGNHTMMSMLSFQMFSSAVLNLQITKLVKMANTNDLTVTLQQIVQEPDPTQLTGIKKSPKKGT